MSRITSGPIGLDLIGVIHTAASNDQIRERRDGISGTVEIFPQYEDALDGIDGFSHIFVFAYFDQLRQEQIGPLKVRPRGLVKYGFKLEDLPQLGVFALDSPTRPNPIGLSLLPLLGRNGNVLTVTNLEYFDRTPVIDIKPYQSGYRVDEYKVPDWHEQLSKRIGRTPP